MGNARPLFMSFKEENMAKKYILSVCGTGGVTSSMITQKVQELAAQHKIEVDVTNSNAFSVKSKLESRKYDLIITSTRIKSPDDSVPVVNCMAFLTGVNEDATAEKILSILREERSF